MSKLTLHCQNVPSWIGMFLARARASHVKCVGIYPTYPGVVTIGRVVHADTKEPEPLNSLIRRGAEGADILLGHVWPEIEKNPQVGLWELYNEATIWDPSVLAGFAAFNQRLIARAHALGIQILVGAINTGWPLKPSEDGGKMLDVIARAVDGADGISLHEYEPAAMWQAPGANCLRYRHLLDYFLKKGYYLPPVYITECGLDKTPGGPSHGHFGWRSILHNNEDEYIEQLMWYESELQQDSYVRCATIFTTGPVGWEDFEMYESISMRLADRLGNPPIPPPPPTGDGMRIIDRNGVERDRAWLEARYGPVQIIETPGPGYHVTELREATGYSTVLVYAQRADGTADVGKRIARWWPGCSPPLPSGLNTWKTTGVYGVIEAKGHVDFGMGSGDYYYPPNTGASWYWVEGNSDCAQGWGMLGGTNHDHLDIVFRWGPGSSPPTEPPAPPANVAASDGTYSDKVHVTWDAVAGANLYKVLRFTAGVAGSSVALGNTADLTFDDLSAEPGLTYKYWVRARNEVGWGPASTKDTGYTATGGPDIEKLKTILLQIKTLAIEALAELGVT